MAPKFKSRLSNFMSILLLIFVGVNLIIFCITLPIIVSGDDGENSVVIQYLHAFVNSDDGQGVTDGVGFEGADINFNKDNNGQQLSRHQHDTGAFANCTEQITAPPSAGDHPDQKIVTISCHSLAYRMRHIQSSETIIIGVLSAAGGNGPNRRNSIRKTWARGHTVFFIVAGPWGDIENEYDTYRDLIWLDREEDYYEGLTFKTLTFIQAVHDLVASESLRDVTYAFKTDDDCFINTLKLNREIGKLNDNNNNNSHEVEKPGYWGECTPEKYKPKRDPSYKWSVGKEIYPEEYYPRYCQGAGFAVSRKFFDCAANPTDGNIANMRFMPFEDAAVGLLAERCGIEPTTAAHGKLINQMRTPLKIERDHVKHGLPKIEKKYLTFPQMVGRVVQHRVYDEWDMEQHWRATIEPRKFKRETDFPWYQPAEDEIYRWKDDVEHNPEARRRAGLE